MVRDKWKRGRVSGEETDNAVLVRAHDSFTVLWNSSVTLPPIFHTKLLVLGQINDHWQ